MLTSHDLYGKYSKLYALIADDRDFVYELNKMGVCKLDPSSTFVELFAGPAYHSKTLRDNEIGWNGTAIAIDRSKEMVSLAKERGFNGTYICSDAIQGLSSVTQAQIICIARYSIVLVDSNYLKKLFELISKVLCNDGFLFLEIHKDSLVNKQSPICGDWQQLGIYRREVKTKDCLIECFWPFNVEVIDKNIFDMSVKVKITDESGQTDELYFNSREHMHSREDLDKIASLFNLGFVPDSSFDTESGYFLAYQKQKNSTSDFEVGYCEKNEKFQSLEDKALCYTFDLSTPEKRRDLIKNSGLDISSHDSPLSLHIYNLL
jgi:hypothetical protein